MKKGNRYKCMRVLYKGERLTVKEIARKMGISEATLRYRASKMGSDGETAISLAIAAWKPKPTKLGKLWIIGGEARTIKGWAEKLSKSIGRRVDVQALNNRARYRGGGKVTQESLEETLSLYLRGKNARVAAHKEPA